MTRQYLYVIFDAKKRRDMNTLENENALDNSTGRNHSGRGANNPVRVLTAKSIIGDKISNRDGEDLGAIEDIMLNIDEGKVEYVIISFGGFMSLNQKYFAIPFASLVIDTKQHAFILDQARSVFEESPGFDKEHWPDANFHLPLSHNYGGFMGANTGSDH
jgi:sporulation protein YlmC with PRC-barrel domain